MKKQYNGLEAIKISLDHSGQVIHTSNQCSAVWTSHFDYDDDQVCDGAEALPGSSEVVTQSYNNCPDNDVD